MEEIDSQSHAGAGPGTQAQLERELELTRGLAAAMTEPATVELALERSVEMICGATGWEIGHAWVPLEESSLLGCVAGWYADPSLEPFAAVSRDFRFEPGTGLPGRVWERGTACWIPDLGKDLSLPRRPFAAKAGLATGMGVPVLAGERPVAVLEFFTKHRREEDVESVRLVSAVAAHFGPLLKLRQAQERLRDSEEHFRAIAETATDAFVSADADGRIRNFNGAAERMFGYPRKSVIGKSLTMLMPERFRQEHSRAFARFRTTGEGRYVGRTMEFRGRRSDGTEFPLELSLAAFTRLGKRVATGLIRDISWRKVAEEHLRKRDAHLAEVHRLAALGSWEWDPETDEFQGSAEFLRIYGFETHRGPLPSERVWERNHPDDAENIRLTRQRVLREGGEFSVVHRMVLPGGEVRTLHDRGKATRDQDGRTVRVIGTTQDVTEREQSRQELLGSRARLQTVLDNIAVSIYMKDLRGRYLLVNEEASEFLGGSPDEVIGKTDAELLPVELAGRLGDGDRRVLETGQGMEEVLRLEDERTIRFQKFPLRDENGDVYAICGTATDVSGRSGEEARVPFEAALRDAHRLETLGRLSGGVAHDFNNLLAVILSSAAVLQATLPQGSEAIASVAEIRRAAARAAQLTQQLLAISRPEPVELRVLSLNDVVRDCELLLRRTLGADVRIEIELDDALWKIEGDPGQIERVLLNLALNSRDAMPRGGTLSVRTDNVVEGNDRAEYVRLRVADTGYGMKRDVAARAFEPFFTTKASGEGTGLGLATVYGIVAQSGGTAELSSSPDVGTTVTMRFPALRP